MKCANGISKCNATKRSTNAKSEIARQQTSNDDADADVDDDDDDDATTSAVPAAVAPSTAYRGGHAADRGVKT